MPAKKIHLGQEVKDKVTGFQGIAVCRITYLTGCDRIGVQPPKREDNSLSDECSFDEPMLDVVGDGIYVPPKRPTGGPHHHLSRGRKTKYVGT